MEFVNAHASCVVTLAGFQCASASISVPNNLTSLFLRGSVFIRKTAGVGEEGEVGVTVEWGIAKVLVAGIGGVLASSGG
jgi:hypothetical protein